MRAGATAFVILLRAADALTEKDVTQPALYGEDPAAVLESLAEPGAPAPRLLDLVPDGAASRDDVLEEPDRTVSFVQEEQAHEEQLRSRTGSGSSSSGGGTPAEDSAGVPPEGYRICAEQIGGTCMCRHGEVRYGVGYGSAGSWTHPVKLGDTDSILCNLQNLQESRSPADRGRHAGRGHAQPGRAGHRGRRERGAERVHFE